MPNSRHFHGQSHMRGGITIDESTLDDNAKYWANGARGAYNHLIDLVGFEKANELIASFWNDEYTWKKICIKTEKLVEQEEKNKNGNN